MALQLDDYRLLGRSGLRVSPLALGTMTFRVGAVETCVTAKARLREIEKETAALAPSPTFQTED